MKRTKAKCSKATPKKQIGFANFLNYHMSLTKAILNNHNYYPDTYIYIDMNAGPGYYDELNIAGSPVFFLEAAKRNELKYKAHFIDENSETIKILKNRVDAIGDNFTLMNGDHKELVPKICKTLDKNTFGLIYHDPNGMPDFELFEKNIFNKFNTKKLDLLIRVSATTVKRSHKAYPEKYRPLSEYIKGIGKTTWLIAQVEDKDPQQWTFLFGCNFANLRDWKNAGFYLLDSEEGKEILQTINLTKEELESLKLAEQSTEHEYFFGNGAVDTLGCTFEEEWNRVMDRECRNENKLNRGMEHGA